MDAANFVDEMECGNFFDHIDDLLDFPTDVLDTDLIGASADCGSFPSILAGNSSDALLSSDSVFSGSTATDLSDQLSIPYEDIVQLEWLSIFVEDSFSGGGMTMEKSNISSISTIDSSQIHHQFQTSSPISVLESSSSCSNGKKKARSKRPRQPTFTPRPSIQLTEATHNAIFIPCLSPDFSTTSFESNPQKKAPKKSLNDPPKKKKIKIVPPSNPADSNPSPSPNASTQAVRKCMHCEITKTPQWRAGPMGPKTLCNACGVRHKSGRLFPEYRPAASPTFIPSVHSNSHKKVIEMRTKTSEENVAMPANISI